MGHFGTTEDKMETTDKGFFDRRWKWLSEWARILNVHPKGVHRWRHGVRGVVLPAFRYGGRWMIFEDDMQAFIRLLSNHADQPSPSGIGTTSTQSGVQLGSELENAGW